MNKELRKNDNVGWKRGDVRLVCCGGRFFADAMLGKLARWMRVMGYDVLYERYIEDRDLVERALKDGRVILTRDTLLMKRRKVGGMGFFIEADTLPHQLRQVVHSFPIDRKCLLTRCLICNIPLESVTKVLVYEEVPRYVYNTQEEFTRCPACRRVYWRGTHREGMVKTLNSILGGTVY